MAQEFSFDVVSKVDLQAAEDAVNTANKEMSTRFDFKASVSKIELNKKDNKLTLFSDDENKLKSVIDILQGRLIKRGISLKNLDYKAIEQAGGNTVRQEVVIQQGIPTDKAKAIAAKIKETKIKVNPSIQGDQLRITSASKDNLQTVMTLLKTENFGLDLQFTNYR